MTKPMPSVTRFRAKPWMKDKRTPCDHCGRRTSDLRGWTIARLCTSCEAQLISNTLKT